jgi:hypothetical protein
MRKERWSSPAGSGSPVPKEPGLFDPRIPGPGDIRRIGPRAPKKEQEDRMKSLAAHMGQVQSNSQNCAPGNYCGWG